MKIIPVIKCRFMNESVTFYTKILGFRLKYPGEEETSPVVDLVDGNAEIQLSVLAGDGAFGSAVNISVDNVEDVYRNLLRNGLDTSGHEDSPVHQHPVDQTWGTREFYVTDPGGNTIRFREMK